MTIAQRCPAFTCASGLYLARVPPPKLRETGNHHFAMSHVRAVSL